MEAIEEKNQEINPQILTEIEELIINLFKRGSIIGFIQGRRNTGKTDFSLYIAETLYKYNILKLVATNIKVDKSPFKVENINNLDDLKSWCSNNYGKKLFILDEAGKTIRRRSPLTKLNIEILDELQVLRHYSLSILLLAPSSKYIDSNIFGTDILDLNLQKLNYKNALWFDVQREESFHLKEIYKSSIEFDTFNVATFKRSDPTSRPRFKDEDLNKIYMWSNGATIKELGMDKTIFRRILKKYLKETLEKKGTGNT